MIKKMVMMMAAAFAAVLSLMGDVVEYTYNYIDNGDGTVTLYGWKQDQDEGYWYRVGGVSPAPEGDFIVPDEIDGKRIVAIGDDVFSDGGLTSIVIPASVTNLTAFALYQSYNLTNITVAADNPAYKSVDGILYTKDGKTLVACPRSSGGDIAVASGTERIEQNAFYGNCYLISVSLPVGLKSIGDAAFAYDQNENFTSVTIPAGVESIGAQAFGYCSNLSTVTFAGAEGDIDISNTAFVGTPYNATKPFSLIVDDWGNLVGIHGVAPENLLLAYYLNGQTLTGIADNALSAGSYNTASVTNIVVPEGVTWIGYSAFASDAALASVTLPNTLQSISYGAFADCTSLRTIRIPAGVTYVENAFYDCTNLTVHAPSTLRDSFSVPEENGCRIKYYEVSECTVTFNANGGTVDGAATTAWAVYEGRRLDSVDEYYDNYDLPEPTRSGYAFLGWFTAAEGGDEVTGETVVIGDMTLYAHWEEIVYTYNYIDNGDGTVTLSKWDEWGNWIGNVVTPSPVGEFTVPDEIDGKRVVAIGSNFFDDYSNMTSLVIPASVTNISVYAFYCAYDLTNITVAADNPSYKDVDGIVYTKDGRALVACPRARGGDIAVASGTERIEQNAFYGNGYLTSVSLPSGMKSIGDAAFAYCQNESFTSVTIPAGMESIGAQAFGYCSNLATVTFAGAEGDIDIADTAFAGTPYDAAKPFSLIVNEWGNLVGIHGTAPENLVLADYLNGQTLTGIADNALSAGSYNTASVTNIVIPEGVAWINDYAFNGCAVLENVTLPTSLQNIGYGVFGYCTSLRAIRIPVGVTSVGNAFYGCTNLTVRVPSTLHDTFSVSEEDGCRIEYYEVPEYTVTFNANGGVMEEWDEVNSCWNTVSEMSWTVLDRHALGSVGWVPWTWKEGSDDYFTGWFDENGVKITEDTIVTNDMTVTAHWIVDDGTFKMVVIDGVLVKCFGECPAVLTADDFPAGVTSIGYQAFGGKTTLTEVELPETVTNIEDYAFYDCYNLSRITLNAGLKGIGGYAFAWCNSLTNVVIPATVDNIGDYAFSSSGLSAVEFAGGKENVSNLSDCAFYNTPYERDLPFEMIVDGEGVVTGFHGTCPAVLTSVDWPEGVTAVGNAFGNVYDLTSVAIPEGVTSLWEYAFNGCSSLTNVVIPASMEEIGTYAFTWCTSLATVTFVGAVSDINISESAFDRTPWGDENIPFSLNVSEYGELQGWHGRCPSDLTIPTDVISISSYAFQSCSSLESLTIPTNNVDMALGYGAFSNCSNLKYAYIPKAMEGTFNEYEIFYGSPVVIYYYEGDEPTFVSVMFNANGGTVEEAVISVVLDNAIGALPDPTRNGYAFLGWFTEAEGGDEVTAETVVVVTGDMTLYAHWEEITYTYNYIDNGDGTVTLSRHDANGNWVDEPISPLPVGEFTVPEEIDGKRVVAIGSDVFDGCADMTSIVIPSNVTDISVYALNDAFVLTNIMVVAENPAYKDIDGILYTKDGKTLVTYPRGKGGDVIVAAGTECIGYGAFCYNGNLTSVSFPAELKRIDGEAFSHCYNLEVVTFAGAEGDVDIADTAFVGTPYDAAKPFALIVDEWGNLVGIHGVARENLVLADYLNGQTLTGISGNALSAGNYYTASVTNIVVPEGVTWIGDYAFAADAALENVTLPTSLQSIGYGAFSYCTSLRAIRIPAGVTSVNNAFYGCENLTVTAPSTLRDTFSVPDGCTIEYYEVPECTVTLDANGGTVNGDANAEVVVLQGRMLDNWPMPYREGYDFAGWFGPDGKRLQYNFVVTENVTFTARWLTASPWYRETCYQGENGEQIGVAVVGAESIVMTNGVLTIPATLTALNDNGEEVELPVVVIEGSAFEDWRRIETLVLPASVKVVEAYAFGWCHSLTNVTFLGNQDLIEMDVGYAFAHTPWLDAHPFTWMTSEEEGVVFLNGFYGSPVPDDTLVIPAGVTAISSHALPYWNTVSDGDGYRLFLGWYTAAEGGERVDRDMGSPGIIVEIAGGTTLYAHWEAVEPEWFFDVEDGLAIITGNAVSLVGDVAIPASVTVEEDDGEGYITEVSYPVVAISRRAFYGAEITSVTIPASVTNIGNWAFEDCANLTNVVFAGGMEGIEMRVASAFYGTPWLEAYLASLPAPENDDLADAAQIAGASGRVTGTNIGAGIEDGEPLNLDDYESTATVWWRWTAPASGPFMFMTQDSSFDTVMGVYTGTFVDSLVTVAEDDDGGPDSTSAVTFDAVAGTTYYIAVGGYAENVGDIVLSWNVDTGVIVEAGDNVVAANGDGTYTVTAPAGGELTEDDVYDIDVKARLDGEWVYTTDGYDIVFGGGVITVSLKKPEVDTDLDPDTKDPDDKSGFLVDPDMVFVAAEPDVGEGETLGALPVKAVPGLWYRASWGDSLHGLTTGEAVQADDEELYLGVIRQDGAAGFYKVSVSDHAQ